MGEHWKDKRFGEVTWHERPKDRMKISSRCVNTVRILDAPETFNIHWVKKRDYDGPGGFSLQKCAEPAPPLPERQYIFT